jgi:hypothetical protein
MLQSASSGCLWDKRFRVVSGEYVPPVARGTRSTARVLVEERECDSSLERLILVCRGQLAVELKVATA